MELLCRFTFFHESGGEFEDAGAFRYWKLLVIDAQKEDLWKLEAFGSVHGHQLDGVAGEAFFQTDHAASLGIVVQILDKFGKAFSVALWFPLFGELREARDVLTVLRAGAS